MWIVASSAILPWPKRIRGEGSPPCWPVIAFRNVYVLPGVPSILQRKFTMIREAPGH